MTFMDVFAHFSILRRKRRGIQPAEIQEALRRIPPAILTQSVSEWAEQVFQAQGSTEGEGIAIDGKVVRGSRTDDQDAVHLLSALAHDLKLVLGQTPVPDHTNEIGGIDPLLAELVLDGRIVTVDAHLTQRDIAETIREKGGTTGCPSKKTSHTCTKRLSIGLLVRVAYGPWTNGKPEQLTKRMVVSKHDASPPRLNSTPIWTGRMCNRRSC